MMKQQSESDMLDLKNRERAASMAPIQDGLASVENETYDDVITQYL